MTQKHIIRNSSIQLKDADSPIVSYDTKIIGTFDEPTLKLFGLVQAAYNFFKTNLFSNELSRVILTLNHYAKSYGYYLHSAWLDEAQIILPEINISPKALALPSIDIMAILVHEMAHHYQYLHGNPGRSGYHNREFAKIMYSLGLMCSDTGKPGGRITGQRMSHYTIKGGKFENVFFDMPQEYILPFRAFPSIKRVRGQFSKNKSKSTYHCYGCGINLWGRPKANVICGDCELQLVLKN
jgi:SprT-like family